MKFGKTLAKKQLEIPEYGASFVNYKALKKLIKSLSRTAVQNGDSQTTLQANKATFFFRIERELEKVNAFYLQKEAELKLRLKTLTDKKKSVQLRSGSASKLSATYVTLREGFQQFELDLSKLQQFVEINATAFSKILKKWDKSSKSRTKELYISRAVEVQPCFNREVITELSDQATTSLMELEAWAEGENFAFTQARTTDDATTATVSGSNESDTDAELLNAVLANNTSLIRDWIARVPQQNEKARERVTRIFLAAVPEGSDHALSLLIDTGMVNLHAEDEINERNCLHEAAITGRISVLSVALKHGVDVARPDVYGRISLHYAALRGQIDLIKALIEVNPSTIDLIDHDNFTPLIHAITRNEEQAVRVLIASGARVDPRHEQDHVPLNLACQHGLVAITQILLEQKAQILADAEGLYPQHLLARSGHSAGHILLLQKYGADINELDKLFQWTPVFHAASEGHVECLRALLSFGARADVLDEKGLSAMYYAAWEGHISCMHLLSAAGGGLGVAGVTTHRPSPSSLASASGSGSVPMAVDPDGIPALSLPPPILPLRRYGHNFLENKTFVQLTFAEVNGHAIHFDDSSKYPAARITISSKSSDLIPRNFLLPLTEDSRVMSFQVDSLENFAIDFDIYPTIGSKVIARTTALSNSFVVGDSSSGHCILPLFDPRLRAIGRISFDFQIIRSFHGVPLEASHFATYWKATSQFDDSSSALVTGSSLAGEYVRLTCQLTSDGIPVVYPERHIEVQGISIPICNLAYQQFKILGQQRNSEQAKSRIPTADSLAVVHDLLKSSFYTLPEALASLSPSVHVELYVMFPEQDCLYGLYKTPNINQFVDTILETVFEHARVLKETSPNHTRSIVFSSSETNICTSLNWKQPNYPVFYCSGLDADPATEVQSGSQIRSPISSIKEAVRFASGNNLMGLMCSSTLLTMVPALVQSVKSAGLVMVSHILSPDGQALFNGADGVLRNDGILMFQETIDM